MRVLRPKAISTAQAAGGTITDLGGGRYRFRRVVTLAEVVALGAATTGQITLFSLPAGGVIQRNRVANGGGAATTLATLTASIGHTTFVEQLAAATVFAANAVNQTAPVAPLPSATAATALKIQFVGNANLSTLTGLGSGVIVEIDYLA